MIQSSSLLGKSHPDSLKIEHPQILADIASTSHATFGNFILEEEQEQLVFLRSMNTIELYRRVIPRASTSTKEAEVGEEKKEKPS